MSENLLFVHGCGGAGFTQVYKVMPVLKNLGEGFTRPECRYLDTTDKNARYVNVPKELVYLFDDDRLEAKRVDGSGGERRHHVDVITAKIDDYVDSLPEYDSTVWHVIVYSAGGGSGSVIGPILHRALLVRDQNVISVVTGDTSTMVLTRNTLNTLRTLVKISRSTKRPVIVRYNNNVRSDTNYKDGILTTDTDIVNFMVVFSLFASGRHYSIDNTDIRALLSYTHLSSLNITPDLSEIDFGIGQIHESDDRSIVCALTLTDGSKPISIGVESIPHWKYGKLYDKTGWEQDKLPVHIWVSKLGLQSVISDLTDRVEENTKRLARVSESTIDIGGINGNDKEFGDIVL